MSFARRYPELTLSLTSVEGNLTRRDVFWSQKIATRSLAEIGSELAGLRAGIAGLIGGCGVTPTPSALATAVLPR